MPEALGGVTTRLAAAIAHREIPAAVAVVGTAAETYPPVALGVRRYGGPVATADTRFDLASLTKVTATLPAVLRLVGEGEVTLRDPVGRFFSNAGWFQRPSVADATLGQLLSHSSGLPDWRPIFSLASTRLTALANALQTPLGSAPGTVVYSDLGFILLGAVVERVTGQRLDAFTRKAVFEPLGMGSTGFGPLSGVPVAATENCGWRGRLLEGEVHDENAFVMDGVAGHAGLFGTAGDLALYARAWLEFAPRLGCERLLRKALREHACGGGRSVGLGWMLLADGGYQHTGFTGTSLRVEPERGWFAVLLTNRVHPDRRLCEGVDDLRASFHEVVRVALS